MRIPRFTVLLPLLLLASCAPDKKETATPPRKSLTERMSENNGYKQDAEGNWKPQTDRRSPYENKGATYDSKKSFQKKDYKAGDYAKKSWWGNKEYDRKAYDGNTDGSRFETTSRLQGKGAREAGNAADIPDNYQTGTYATGSAREAANAPIQKGTSAAIENHKDDYAQPEIIDWRQQRALSVDQSKGILGR